MFVRLRAINFPLLPTVSGPVQRRLSIAAVTAHSSQCTVSGDILKFRVNNNIISQRTHCLSITKANRLVLFIETIAVCYENHMQQLLQLCNVEPNAA